MFVLNVSNVEIISNDNDNDNERDKDLENQVEMSVPMQIFPEVIYLRRNTICKTFNCNKCNASIEAKSNMVHITICNSCNQPLRLN